MMDHLAKQSKRVDKAISQQLNAAKGSDKSALRRQARKVREQILRDMGLVKVRGALGGTYWE